MPEPIRVEFRKLTEIAPCPVVRVWTSDSASRPGIQHLTLKLADDSYICSCDGFQFNGMCWHTTKAEKL